MQDAELTANLGGLGARRVGGPIHSSTNELCCASVLLAGRRSNTTPHLAEPAQKRPRASFCRLPIDRSRGQQTQTAAAACGEGRQQAHKRGITFPPLMVLRGWRRRGRGGASTSTAPAPRINVGGGRGGGPRHPRRRAWGWGWGSGGDSVAPALSVGPARNDVQASAHNGAGPEASPDATAWRRRRHRRRKDMRKAGSPAAAEAPATSTRGGGGRGPMKGAHATADTVAAVGRPGVDGGFDNRLQGKLVPRPSP